MAKGENAMALRKTDYSISFARLAAMIFIITCHFLQNFNNELANWFNVGVQMFFFISGYLYGMKKEISPPEFYKKNLKKILVDYYIFIIAFFVLMLIFDRERLSVELVYNALIVRAFPYELGNLWFVPYILLCYLITPVLLPVIRKAEESHGFGCVVRCLLLLGFIELVFVCFQDYFKAAWINCYVLGMIICSLEQKEKIWKAAKVIIAAVCVLMNVVKIYINNFSAVKFSGFSDTLYNEWQAYAHVLLGICLVMLLRWLYKKIKQPPQQLLKILDMSDVYSYDIYLVHQMFIMRTYSVVNVCESKIIGTVLALAVIAASGWLLNKLAGLSRKYIPFLKDAA